MPHELFTDEVLSDSTAQLMGRRISFFLSLEDDIKPFYSIARDLDDGIFYPLVERLWAEARVSG